VVRPRSLAPFFVFFLWSGFCSLVYQVVWLRLAMAQFGVTTPMVSLVLSLFMGGLALGSVAAARLGRRLGGTAPVLLRLYAFAELLIGLSAFVVPAGTRRRFVDPHRAQIHSAVISAGMAVIGS